MFCIGTLCWGTAQCGGQMRDKGTAVNVGFQATERRGQAPCIQRRMCSYSNRNARKGHFCTVQRRRDRWCVMTEQWNQARDRGDLASGIHRNCHFLPCQ